MVAVQGPDRQPKAELGPGETLDQLCGGWWIFQLRRGHRYATDDVLTAWTAVRAHPAARRVLDLGAGVGSIGLMTLRLLPSDARLVSVEVLAESVGLARRTVALNGLTAQADVRLGDLRDVDAIAPTEAFDIITANPPFLPPGTGWLSPHPQRRAARFELHGDVFDSCRAAARHLAPDGIFCLCHAASDPRPERAVREAGLVVLERRSIVFRQGRPPRIAIYTCAREGPRHDPPDLCVRDARGERTTEHTSVLRHMLIVE